VAEVDPGPLVELTRNIQTGGYFFDFLHGGISGAGIHDDPRIHSRQRSFKGALYDVFFVPHNHYQTDGHLFTVLKGPLALASRKYQLEL
jgi:hypothetical protein